MAKARHSKKRPLLSVVVPVYNEEDNLALLHARLEEALAGEDVDWELVLVDDGSSDGSAAAMRALHERDKRVKAVLLSRNFGHEVASTAGLDAARGDVAVLMDADLQDPPETIPVLLAKWREGYDIVSAQRASREGESAFKRASAFAFYRLMNALIGFRLPPDTGDFRLVSRKALDAFLQCRERNRFVRALSIWTGFRQAVVPFNRASRHAGETKYGVAQLVNLAFSSIASFSLAPLRIATLVGVVVVLLSLVFIAVIVVQKLTGVITEPGYAFLMASIWFLGGVQCLLIGILGEYLGMIYTEVRRRPLYFVREFLGGGDWPPAARRDVDADES